MQPDDILLTDQVAIVTGAGAGIGQGIAAGMAAFGADVVIAEIDPDRAAVTAALVEAAGRRPLVVATDMADTDQVRAMVEQASAHFGRIDILVNNVGGVRQQAFLAQSERSWRRHIDLNLVSMLAATSAAAPVMIAGGRGGSIVNIASIEALRAAPLYAVYAACKAGMASFTRTAALELSEHRIRVNCLTPDVITTPGVRGIVRGPVPDVLPPGSPTMDRYVPLGGEGHVDDTASAAVFLSSKLARYITGVILPVDGGTWASSGWTRGSGGAGWELHDSRAD